jgi:hypothetical protein
MLETARQRAKKARQDVELFFDTERGSAYRSLGTSARR